MSNPSSTPQNPVTPPLLSRDRLMSVLSSPSRLAMLTALCDGEPLATSDFAKIAGCSISAAYKHAQVMLGAGVVLLGRGKLYRIAPGFQPQPGQRVLDFGHCLVRLDYQAGS